MRRSSAVCLTLPLLVLTGCWGSPTGGPPTAVSDAETKSAVSPAKAAPSPSATATWGTSYDAALDAAKKRNVMVLADFTGSDWCPWCIRLHQEVFDTPEFEAWAATRVTLLEVDFPRRPLSPELTAQNSALQEKFGIEGFPTVLLLDGNGQKVGELGYVKGGPAVWIRRAQEILDARAR